MAELIAVKGEELLFAASADPAEVGLLYEDGEWNFTRTSLANLITRRMWDKPGEGHTALAAELMPEADRILGERLEPAEPIVASVNAHRAALGLPPL